MIENGEQAVAAAVATREPGFTPFRRFVASASVGTELFGTFPIRVGALDGVQYLYVEGGAGAADSFLKADLVDRLEIYRAPIVIGGGMPAVRDIGLPELAQAHHRWQRVERRMLGPDTFEAFVRTRGES